MKIYELFVAKNGDNKNNGEISSPFASVDMAVKAASKIRSEYDEIYIYVREGEYTFTDTLELSDKTTGKGNARIIIKAYKDENVSFTGGKTIPASDLKPVTNEDDGRIKEKVKDKILCVDLKNYGITEFGEIRHRSSVHDILPSEIELFVDGDEANRVTFPKNGKRIKYHEEDFVKKSQMEGCYFPLTDEPYGKKIDFSDDCPIIKYNFPEADRWGKAHDAYAFGYLGNGFFDHTMPVQFDTQKKEIQFKSYMKITSKAYWNTFSFINVLEEMDTPGEYYIDSKSLILFYYPKGNVGYGESCTDEDYRTHFSLWCMLGAPLMIGGDIRKMNDFCKNLLKNEELIKINQDNEARPPYIISKNNVHIMLKFLENDEYAMGVFNMGESNDEFKQADNLIELGFPVSSTILFSDFGFPATCGKVFEFTDIFTGQTITTKGDSLSVETNPHECKIYKLKVKKA